MEQMPPTTTMGFFLRQRMQSGLKSSRWNGDSQPAARAAIHMARLEQARSRLCEPLAGSFLAVSHGAAVFTMTRGAIQRLRLLHFVRIARTQSKRFRMFLCGKWIFLEFRHFRIWVPHLREISNSRAGVKG